MTRSFSDSCHIYHMSHGLKIEPKVVIQSETPEFLNRRTGETAQGSESITDMEWQGTAHVSQPTSLSQIPFHTLTGQRISSSDAGPSGQGPHTGRRLCQDHHCQLVFVA